MTRPADITRPFDAVKRANSLARALRHNPDAARRFLLEAAAPDMHAALTSLVAEIQNKGLLIASDKSETAFFMARNALRKAEGCLP
jgi:hypothetical protein